MKIRMKTTLMVIGKPTQQGKKDATQTYYYALVSQGEEDAGRIRVANVDVYNRIEKYKEQLFTCEYNEQFNSFSIVGVEPIKDTPDNSASTGTGTGASNTGTPDTGKAPDADKSDKKH